MNEHISGLNIPTTLLLSLLTKLWIDVCVALAFPGLDVPIFEMGGLDGTSPVHPSIHSS